MPALRRLPQLVGERPERVELDIHATPVREHPEAVQAVIAPRENPLLVPDLRTERDQLVSHCERLTAGELLGALDRDPVALERERERGGVAAPPRDLQRLFRKPDSAITGGIV